MVYSESVWKVGSCVLSLQLGRALQKEDFGQYWHVRDQQGSPSSMQLKQLTNQIFRAETVTEVQTQPQHVTLG